MTPIVELIAPRLLPIASVVAIALIVKGYANVGEGFGAGVIVALAIGLRYVVLGPERADRTIPIVRAAPLVAVTGLLIALGSGFFGLLFGSPPFTHYPPPGEPVVRIGALELTTAVAFDVGIFLLVVGAVVMLIRQLSWLVAEDDS
ncbi:MAG TPA: MnhB domain-containing protein [Candidatus Limnocylindrales bacterium]|nr:MnhB domain-containing protein [Candidatus Limnocylindrales bacterium]